jgi:hypothetical protein
MWAAERQSGVSWFFKKEWEVLVRLSEHRDLVTDAMVWVSNLPIRTHGRPWRQVDENPIACKGKVARVLQTKKVWCSPLCLCGTQVESNAGSVYSFKDTKISPCSKLRIPNLSQLNPVYISHCISWRSILIICSHLFLSLPNNFASLL